jgi:predicted ATPase
VFGDAPNVAARVQAAAEPGSVLVTMNVQRQVAGLFVAEEQGARELKGVSESVQLFRIVRASGARRRSSGRSLTPFVGREEELGVLARRWERAAAGEGQLVLIVGEPGLGKSRLIEEFHTRLAETPHTWTEWSASQLLQNTPLHPVTEWGRLRFGVDAPPDQRLADLEGTLRLIGLDPAEYAPLVAPLVDVQLPPARAANLPPEEMRRRQLAAMTNLVLAGARSQPVVLAFEDLHWADPTSLDLLRALAERGAKAPLLLLATTRPEFRAPWSLRAHHSLISLSPLDRAGVARMVGEISARHAQSNEVIEGVNERTGGVPLFVEEVTRLLLERGEQGGVQAIPPTLQQSLAARLDRLGPAREIAQIGAVLGRDFAYALLRNVAELDEPALQASLDRLADADLLFVEGAPPQASYRFKHALIQDAAYDSLLKSRRQALHRRAAELLRDDPDRAAAEPEIIAHHFTQAGLDDLAIEWWGKAGDQALRRSAFQEAIAHLGKAIAMADKSAGAAARPGAGDAVAPSQRVKLQTDYGQAVMYSKGFAAEETKAAFARATELAATTDDFSQRFAAAHGQWTFALVRGELKSAREMALPFLREAENEGCFVEAGVARRGLALISYLLGDFVEARAHCERALAACDPERDREARERFGEDTGCTAMSVLAQTMWQLGKVERARELIEMANRRAAKLGHIPSMAHPLQSKFHVELLRGDAAAALAAAEALAALGRDHGMAHWRADAELYAVWARCRFHDLSAGGALAAWQGERSGGWFSKALLAELELETHRAESALARIDEALALVGRVEYRDRLAFLHRLRGEILLKRDPGNPAPAEQAFETAIAIAKEQGARSWGLRAALSLAKLYQSTARLVEAHAVLAPACEGFSPTPEMPEIAEAQAVLTALAETNEVKAAVAQRQRRVDLQTSYARAVSFPRGSAADETKAAFERVSDLATRAEFPAERFSALFGQAGSRLQRGEVRAARDIAERALREADAEGRVAEFGTAHWMFGLAFLFLGDLAGARSELELALNSFDMESDSEASEKFLWDPRAACRASLAQALWYSGDLHRARQFIKEAIGSGRELGPPPSTAYALAVKIYIEGHRNDRESVVADAENLLKVGQQHGMDFYVAISRIYLSWARGGLGDARSGADELRSLLDTYATQSNRLGTPYFLGCLAELEAAAGDHDRAFALIDEGLAMAHEGGQQVWDAFLHRLRGEILLKRDPADPAPAEAAYRTAIAIAKQQGARSYELLASLSLAKLYQSTDRLVDAYTVLAPALEGFTPTPEMPEIAEAQALLESLARGSEGAIASKRRATEG